MRKKLIYRVLFLTFVVGLLTGAYIKNQPAFAAESKKQTILPKQEETRRAVTGSFLILATGDLHGQLASNQYEMNLPDPTVGFSKLATLIREERKAAGESETLLVDAGDTLYSYATDLFYENHKEQVQPIFQAMAMLNYDAITIGNHELDFPWQYIENQLMGSGLYEKTTVSNLRYDDTGENILARSIVTEKRIMMSDGSSQTIRVGVIGATRESLSSKSQRYSGFLCGMNVYESVKEEAARLKETGVEVVVALIHGGIGVLPNEDTNISPGARLAKLPEIDAVICSHTHETFPVASGNYSTFSWVEEQSGLIYGTPVVATGSHAENLGIIELTLSYDENDKITITNGISRISEVKESTPEAEDIVKLNNKFSHSLQKDMDTTEYALAEGSVLTNADCVVKDNALFQLINNAKISFGASYIQEYLPAYADYPLIAVTRNDLDSGDDYIVIEDSINATDVAKVIATAASERPSGYLYLYKISGSKLREWLEYSASIYAQKGTKFETILPSFTKKNTSVSTLLNEDYLSDWSHFFVFDGISYEIDLSKPARFHANGTMISNKNNRIVNLQYQGKNVTDQQQFIIVSDDYNIHFWFMPSEADSAYGIFPWLDGKDIIMDYIMELAEYGPINIMPDNNWCFSDAENYEFAFGTLWGSLDLLKQQDWYYKHVVGSRDGKQFYWGKYITPEQKLSVLLSKGITKETGQYVPIRVNVVSLAKGATIESMVYRKGLLTDIEDPNWTLATKIGASCFYVSNNGYYSVLVKDTLGNRCIAHVLVDNINPGIVDVPKIDFVTNRRRQVSGVAVPNATVWLECEDGKQYSAIAAENGTFTVEMPPQNAGSVIRVWTEEGKKKSEIVEMTIYRTGPNLPSLFDYSAKNDRVMCYVEENQTPLVIIGKKVYIEKGMSERYKKSSIYNSSYTIVETNADWYDEVSCDLDIPELDSGSKFYLYAIDWQNRESLRLEYKVP